MAEMISTASIMAPPSCVKTAAGKLHGAVGADRKSIPAGSTFDSDKLKAAIGDKAYKRLTESDSPGLVPANGAAGDPELPDPNPAKTVVFAPDSDQKKVTTISGSKVEAGAGPASKTATAKPRKRSK